MCGSLARACVAAAFAAACSRGAEPAEDDNHPPGGRGAVEQSGSDAELVANAWIGLTDTQAEERCAGYRRARAARASALPRREAAAAAAEPTGDPLAQPELGAGPILGAITDRSVKIWIRADRAAAWSVRLRPHDDPTAERVELSGPRLTAANDFTASLELEGLPARHRFAYAVWLRAPGGTAAREVASGEFVTLGPEHEPARIRVVVGADISGSGSQPIFRDIQALEPSFVLLLGDQVYADAAEPTRDGFAKAYRRNWNIKHLRDLFRHVPSFMIWDDHEIQDNYWRGKSERYAPAREAYELYVHAHNPEPYRPAQLYYSFRAGDVAFFVLDVRSWRSRNSAADDAHKTMLGAQQKQDLLDWLRCEPARLKVIASAVLWNDWAETGKDAWKSFRTEREELLGFMAREKVGDVLLLSGDQHWSAVFRFERYGHRFYEFLPTPLSKSRGRAPSADSAEILARDDDHFVFGVVDIDTTVEPFRVALTLCAGGVRCQPGEEPGPGTSADLDGDDDNLPFTIRLTETDLGAD